MSIQQRSRKRHKPKDKQPMWLPKTAADRRRTHQVLDTIRFIDDFWYAPKEVDEALRRILDAVEA